jgi:hypothetical protein
MNQTTPPSQKVKTWLRWILAALTLSIGALLAYAVHTIHIAMDHSYWHYVSNHLARAALPPPPAPVPR